MTDTALTRCSHGDEPCHCDESMTCICPACCQRRWPDDETEATP